MLDFGFESETMVLTLYKLDASPPVRAVMMTIEELNIKDVEYITLNILAGEHMTEEFLQMNPQHTIPTLKDDDLVIWESHAIVTYLASTYGPNDTLYPNDPKIRALVDQRLYFDTDILFSSFRNAVRPILMKTTKEISESAKNDITKAYNLTESFLNDQNWIASKNNMTLADICCVSTISSLNEVVSIEESMYPNVIAWWKKMSQKGFYQNTNLPGLLMFRELIRERLAA